MRFLIKTQVLAIIFALFWLININVLAFFDQPGRALQYINWFVYGFSLLLAIIYFLMTKYFIGHKWLAVPLVLVPYFFVYNPIFQRIFLSLINKGYAGLINFLSQSTGTMHLITLCFGLIFGIIFSNRQQKD
jgi:hypothetical protein